LFGNPKAAIQNPRKTQVQGFSPEGKGNTPQSKNFDEQQWKNKLKDRAGGKKGTESATGGAYVRKGIRNETTRKKSSKVETKQGERGKRAANWDRYDNPRTSVARGKAEEIGSFHKEKGKKNWV